MDNEWEVDLKIPDFGAMFTYSILSILSAILGSANVICTYIWITSVYIKKEDPFKFFSELLGTRFTDLGFEMQFIRLTGTMVLISALMFFFTMIFSLFELKGVSKRKKPARFFLVFFLFFVSLILLVLAILLALFLRSG